MILQSLFPDSTPLNPAPPTPKIFHGPIPHRPYYDFIFSKSVPLSSPDDLTTYIRSLDLLNDLPTFLSLATYPNRPVLTRPQYASTHYLSKDPFPEIPPLEAYKALGHKASTPSPVQSMGEEYLMDVEEAKYNHLVICAYKWHKAEETLTSKFASKTRTASAQESNFITSLARLAPDDYHPALCFGGLISSYARKAYTMLNTPNLIPFLTKTIHVPHTPSTPRPFSYADYPALIDFFHNSQLSPENPLIQRIWTNLTASASPITIPFLSDSSHIRYNAFQLLWYRFTEYLFTTYSPTDYTYYRQEAPHILTDIASFLTHLNITHYDLYELPYTGLKGKLNDALGFMSAFSLISTNKFSAREKTNGLVRPKYLLDATKHILRLRNIVIPYFYPHRFAPFVPHHPPLKEDQHLWAEENQSALHHYMKVLPERDRPKIHCSNRKARKVMPLGFSVDKNAGKYAVSNRFFKEAKKAFEECRQGWGPDTY